MSNKEKKFRAKGLREFEKYRYYWNVNRKIHLKTIDDYK